MKVILRTGTSYQAGSRPEGTSRTTVPDHEHCEQIPCNSLISKILAKALPLPSKWSLNAQFTVSGLLIAAILAPAPRDRRDSCNEP